MLVVFRQQKDLKNVPVCHQDDNVARVTRFRNGKLTDLGLLFMPTQ